MIDSLHSAEKRLVDQGMFFASPEHLEHIGRITRRCPLSAEALQIVRALEEEQERLQKSISVLQVFQAFMSAVTFAATASAHGLTAANLASMCP